MRYEYDEINFHNLLYAIRKAKGISLEKLAYGLYTPSMMYYVENNKKLPHYLMRNRLMARLGVSSERYEDFLQYDEYDQWKKFQSIIDAVENENVEAAENLILELESKIDKDAIVERQFLLDMKARTMALRKALPEQILDIYKQAIDLSLLNLNFESIDNYVLAPEEIYIVLKYLMFKNTVLMTSKDVSVHEKKYIKIIEYIQNSILLNEAKAQVYPMAVCGYYDLIKRKTDNNYNVYKELTVYSQEALNLLRSAKRTYYIHELVQLRNDIYKASKQYDWQLISADSIEKENSWDNAIKEVCNEYDVKINIENSGYIYNGSEVYCINDVIKSRRKMFGISREKLAEGVCSVKTLMRIENKQVKAQQSIISALLKKLNLSSNYRRCEVYANNIESLITYFKYLSASNDADIDMASLLTKELKSNLDCRNIWNQQSLIRLINLQKLRHREIDSYRYVQNVKRGLLLTIPDNIDIKPDSYLTNTELMIIFNLWYRGEQTQFLDFLKEKCEFYRNDSVKNHINIYSMIMNAIASQAGDDGKYDYSNEVSKELIVLALKKNRIHLVHKNIVNIAWNNKKEGCIDYMDLKSEKSLQQCILLSDFSNEYKTNSIYKEKLALCLSGEDWTI